MNDTDIANNVAHGFGAANDTQWNTPLGFVKVRGIWTDTEAKTDTCQAMTLYPEVQAAANHDLDEIISFKSLFVIPRTKDRIHLTSFTMQL